MEPLEDRRLLAVFVVNNLGDLDGDGAVLEGSLRQTVELANANEGFDTIMFHDYLFSGPGSGTISLDGRDNGGPLLLTDIGGVEIIGPAPSVLTVYAAGNNRIFLVDDGDENHSSSVTISGLTLRGGSPNADDEDGLGGAILNRESLTLQEVAIMNSSAQGGGAIFNDTGFLQVKRSLIQDNTSLRGGGGIQNGLADQTDNLPRTTIVNSTITGNTAVGVSDGETPTGYGGGVLNLAGTVNIEQSTIYGNQASVDGGGVASQGFDPEIDDETGTAAVTSGLATTNIRSSIIVGNTVAGEPNDVGSIGMIEGEDGADPTPFDPQIHSQGYNLFGVLKHPPETSNANITLPPGGDGDVANVDPTSVFMDDPLSDPPVVWFHDFGGVLPVFMPDINKSGGQMAIDLGDPGNVRGEYDQRGFQFVRAFGVMDIGAAEVQVGNFIVNNLVDEADGRFSDVPVNMETFPFNYVSFFPDFSLREALEFAQKNQESGLPGTPMVSFSDVLTDSDFNPDPTIGTPAPTIWLTLGELAVDFSVIIQGPAFDLEIDAKGNDPTPGVNDGHGSRVFFIADTVEISNLILRGGDQQEFGGAIKTRGDLTLRNSTLLDNSTTGDGGAIFVKEGILLVDGTTIHDNGASADGGGIYIASGNVTVNNSTISGNTGFRGGGIANADGNLSVRYSTITLNTAVSTMGSGVASFRDSSAGTEIRSSIISGNTINDVQHVLPGTDNIISLGYNLVGDGNAVWDVFLEPGDQPETDPMLAPLARLGGPTPVHRLLSAGESSPGSLGSPAINMGDPNLAGLGNVPTYDQRGGPFDRIDLDDDDEGQIDIGAYEIQDDVLLVGDGSPEEGSYLTFVAALEVSNLTPTKESIVVLPTWEGEILPGDLAITDSVDIFGIPGMWFSGEGGTLEILIDDGDNQFLLDVSFDSIRMKDNTRIVSLENLTFTNMEFVNNASENFGGAISQQYGKLTILDSTFIGNSVSGTGNSGGAVHVLGGDLEINNSFLSGNTTDNTGGGKGGAIYIRDGNLTADYLYITGNEAAAATGQGGGIYGRNSTMMLSNAIISGNSTNGSYSQGGGLFAKESQITLIDSAITFNATYGDQSQGGGIFLDGGSLDIQHGNVFGNKTTGQDSSGGGIAAANAEVTVTGTSFKRNETIGNFSDGGGIYVSGGNLTLRDSTLSGNEVSGNASRGGGIFSSTDLTGVSTTRILNSTISGNAATGDAPGANKSLSRGGGLYNATGLTEIQHSTLTDNWVPYLGQGGGVASFGNPATTRTEVLSTIISGNTASDAGEAVVDDWTDVDFVGGSLINSFQSLGYNLIGSGLAVSGGAFGGPGDQVNVNDPMLDPLADNGGLTSTHAILEDSPAINAGDPNFDSSDFAPPMTTDQRWETRVQAGRIDVGAVESSFSPGLAADFDSDGDVDGFDFLLWQRGVGIGPGAEKSDGDANLDGFVNGLDLTEWQDGFGSTATTAVAASPVASSSTIAVSVAPATTVALMAVEPSVAASEAASGESVAVNVLASSDQSVLIATTISVSTPRQSSPVALSSSLLIGLAGLTGETGSAGFHGETVHTRSSQGLGRERAALSRHERLWTVGGDLDAHDRLLADFVPGRFMHDRFLAEDWIGTSRRLAGKQSTEDGSESLDSQLVEDLVFDRLGSAV
jgi:hypothetical protein